jgi:S-adenosylmethionine synthetase
VISLIHEQSQDINQGVDRKSPEEQGAGDQGMMFGYATNETQNYMPLALDISHKILQVLADERRAKGGIEYLRPDAKSQVTIEYSDDNEPIRIDTIVVSTQHDDFDSNDEKMLQKISSDIVSQIVPKVKAIYPEKVQKLFNDKIKYHINPTGKFVIGGPHGDTGLTGRKIIVDTYGGKGAHGGGAFSGKDPSKVDRSAAYAMRHIAKNLVAAGVCTEVLVQISYAIGVAEPTSIFVNTYGSANIKLCDSEIAETIKKHLSFTPYAIETRLKLRNPIYSETAAYGHMGRQPRTLVKVFESPYNGKVAREVELFTWEKLDLVDQFKTLFNV